jgi:hypothetical protein
LSVHMSQFVFHSFITQTILQKQATSYRIPLSLLPNHSLFVANSTLSFAKSVDTNQALVDWTSITFPPPKSFSTRLRRGPFSSTIYITFDYSRGHHCISDHARTLLLFSPEACSFFNIRPALPLSFNPFFTPLPRHVR